MDLEIIGRVHKILADSGMTQSEFAAALATTPSKLSKSLSSQRRFTTTELASAADLGRTTIDWILTGKTPPSYALAARAQQTDLAADVHAVIERLHDAHDQLSFTAPPTLPALPRVTQKHGQLDIDFASDLAAAALDQCDPIDGVHEQDLVATVEECFGVDVALVDLPEGFSGAAWVADDFRIVVVNRRDPLVRRRFTLAHELGHILAGHASDVVSDDKSTDTRTQPERIANSFAAAFLMPEELVRRMVGNRPDADRFATAAVSLRVSPLTLSYRLLNLGLITEAERPSLSSLSFGECLKLAGAEGQAQSLAIRDTSERLPERLVAGHVERYLAGEATATPLARLLGRSPDEVRGLFERPGR